MKTSWWISIWKKLAEFCRLIFSDKTLKILEKRIWKDGEDIYGTQAMFNVLPVPRMTKIFKDFYGSADFRENEITLMTKLAFGKQWVMDRRVTRFHFEALWNKRKMEIEEKE